MSEAKEKTVATRRSFLKSAGIAGAAAGVAATAVASGSKGSEAAAPAGPRSAGYRETDHVRKVYELSRF